MRRAELRRLAETAHMAVGARVALTERFIVTHLCRPIEVLYQVSHSVSQVFYVQKALRDQDLVL